MLHDQTLDTGLNDWPRTNNENEWISANNVDGWTGLSAAWEKPRRDTTKHLQWASGLFTIFWLIALIAIGLYGWREVKVGSAIAPAATSTSSQAAAESATDSAQTSRPEGESTAASTEETNAVETNAVAPPTQALLQHYLVLAIIAAIGILFPSVLLVAFACQRVPRQTKDLQQDLIELGLRADAAAANREIVETLGSDEFLNNIDNSSRAEEKKSAAALAAKMFDEGRDSAWSVQSSAPNAVDKNLWDSTVSAAKDVRQKAWKEAPAETWKELLEERYGWVEYLIPLFLITFFLLVSFVWAFWPKAMTGFAQSFSGSDASLNQYFASVLSGMSALLVAVITAYAFQAFGLTRRFQRSDITPGTYWELFKRLLIVALLGLIITAFIKSGAGSSSGSGAESAQDTSSWLLAFAILAGVFPVGALTMLMRGTQAAAQIGYAKWLKLDKDGEVIKWQADLSQRLLPRHELTMLDDLDQWDVERIQEAGIIGLQGVATGPIEHLMVWTPFPTGQIVDWVDQAILFLTTGAEPDYTYVKLFRKMGLRGATDLLDATKDTAGLLRVVSAAKTITGATKDDPVAATQLAALRLLNKVPDAQAAVVKVKEKKKGDALNGDDDLKKAITTAVAVVRDTKTLAEQSQKQVKAGGTLLSNALDAANALHARFKVATEKADAVEKALETISDNKVSDALAAALKALGEKVPGEPTAKSLADDLVAQLDKIADPLAETQEKAEEFKKKVEEIQKKAEKAETPATGTEPTVPAEVGAAETLRQELAKLAQAAQTRMKEESALEDALVPVDSLVTLVTDEGEDKPKKLLGDAHLGKKEQWKKADNSEQAKGYADAEKLVKASEEILSLIKKGTKAVKDARAEALGSSTEPVLTQEVLETILTGLERNANLRRIQRYLTAEASQVGKPKPYVGNAQWMA